MKLLLDTHIILWMLKDDIQLSEKARNLITDSTNELYYSIVSAWEVSIKHKLHPDKMMIDGKKFCEGCEKSGLKMISIEKQHIAALDLLTRPTDAPAHNDPFDRMLISQAKSSGFYLVTHDSLIPGYKEECIIAV